MGILKIDDALHEQARAASIVMCRLISGQAAFWMKIGMLAEANPTLTFNEIIKDQAGAGRPALRCFHRCLIPGLDSHDD